jgi:hypothetical protein
MKQLEIDLCIHRLFPNVQLSGTLVVLWHWYLLTERIITSVTLVMYVRIVS